MALHVIRLLFLLVVLSITVSFAFQPAVYSEGLQFTTLYMLVPFLVALVAVGADMFWRRKRLEVLSGLFFGVLAGLVIAYALALVVDLVLTLFPGPPLAEHPGELGPRAVATTLPAQPTEAQARTHLRVKRQRAAILRTYRKQMAAFMAYSSYTRIVQLIKLLLGATCVFGCVSFVLQTKDDFRFLIPYVEFSRETKGARPILLDTSVIIDGRIADIAQTRILESAVIVPRFVLAELQAIADSDDKLRRNRGRRGLDILNRLQGSDKVDVKIIESHVPQVEAAADVDAKLVALAESLDGRIITNDYNLNKVAQLRGVDVINVNDLANALKSIVLPGESLRVKVIKPGEESGQGVGYLPDGTMIVVEQGRDSIAREVTITVTSVLQTSAGRMIFGRLDADGTSHRAPHRST